MCTNIWKQRLFAECGKVNFNLDKDHHIPVKNITFNGHQWKYWYINPNSFSICVWEKLSLFSKREKEQNLSQTWEFSQSCLFSIHDICTFLKFYWLNWNGCNFVFYTVWAPWIMMEGWWNWPQTGKYVHYCTKPEWTLWVEELDSR